MKWLSLIKSSLHDIRCCDETVEVVADVPTSWRALSSSLTCVLDSGGKNTGYVHVGTLEQYNTSTSLPTGVYKPNTPSDPDFISNYIDGVVCPVTVSGGGGSPSVHYTTISSFISKTTNFEGIILAPGVSVIHTYPATGLVTFNAYTHVATPPTDYAFTMVIDGVAYDAEDGTVTASDVPLPIYSISFHPLGYVPLPIID